MIDYWNKIANQLEEVRKLMCPYPPPGCDCKFGISEGVNLASSEQTGCPELRQIIHIYRTAAKNDTKTT